MLSSNSSSCATTRGEPELSELLARLAGAGLGVRYETGLGPIRLDVGVPVSGPGASLDTIWDAQLYIGIGQAF